MELWMEWRPGDIVDPASCGIRQGGFLYTAPYFAMYPI